MRRMLFVATGAGCIGHQTCLRWAWAKCGTSNPKVNATLKNTEVCRHLGLEWNHVTKILLSAQAIEQCNFQSEASLECYFQATRAMSIFKPRGPCQPCQGLQFATRLATSGVGHAMTWMMERPTVLSPVGFVLRAPRSRSRHSFIFLGYDCGGPWMTLVYDRDPIPWSNVLKGGCGPECPIHFYVLRSVVVHGCSLPARWGLLDLIRGVLSSYVLLLLLVLLFLLPPLSLLALYVFFCKMEGGVDPIAQYISTSRVLSLLMFSLYHIRIHTWHSTRWPLKLYEINKQLQQPLYNGYWAMR